MKSLWEEWNTWCEVGDKGSGDAGGGGVMRRPEGKTGSRGMVHLLLRLEAALGRNVLVHESTRLFYTPLSSAFIS